MRPLKQTSIRNIEGQEASFVEQSGDWFTIDFGDITRMFHNNQGPRVAIAALEASGWGNSNASRVLYTLIETIETHPEYQAEPEPAVPAATTNEQVWFPGHNLSKLGIRAKHQASERFTIEIVRHSRSMAVSPLKADAEAIALEILEAAGVENVPHDSANGAEKALGYLIEYVGLQKANAKAVANRIALEARRNALAVEFGSSSLGYADTFDSTQRAIDRVIELENAVHGVTK